MRGACSLFLVSFFVTAAIAKEPERWDGTIAFGNLKLPFSMQLRIDGPQATASFTNLGEAGGISGNGSIANDTLKVTFEARNTVLEGKLDGGSLKGVYSTPSGKYTVDAGRFCTCGFQGEAGPDISGTWTLDGAKGKLTVQRKGEDTLAVLTLESAPTPSLAGRFDGAVFTLAYFNGDPAGAAWLEIEPDKDARVLTLVYQKPGRDPVRLKATR